MKISPKHLVCLLLAALLLALGGAALAENAEDMNQSNTQLPSPTVAVGSSYRAGEPLEFAVTSSFPNNSSLSWTLYRRMASYDGVETVSSGYVYYYWGTKRIDLAPYGLDAGQYRLDVYQYGHNNQYTPSSTVSYSFTVTGSRPAVPTVQVLNNHQLTSRTDNVWLIAPGLQEYEAERYYQTRWEDEPKWHNVLSAAGNDSGRVLCSISFNMNDEPEKTQKYRFRALIDGCWSAYTGEVILTWYTRGQAAAPDVTLPAAFRAGEPVVLTVNGTLPGDEELIIKKDGSSWGSEYDQTSIQNGQLVLEKYGRDAGNYQLMITCRKDGYDDSEAVLLTYEVTGERPAAPAGSLSATSIYAGENVTFTAFAPGLEMIEFPTYEKEYMAIGGRAVGVTKPSWSGKISWRARINGCWTAGLATDSVTLNSVDENYLSEPTPRFGNRTITVGQDFTFPIDVDSRTELLTVGIVQVEERGDGYYSRLREVEYEMVVEAVNGQVTIPGDRFTNPGLYRFNFNAYSENFYGSYTEGYIVEAAAPRASVNVSVDLNVGTAIEAYQDLPVTITAPGCSRVMLKVTYTELERGYDGYAYFNDQITVSGGRADVTIENLMANCKYTFTARGYNGTGWTDWSEPRSLTTYYAPMALDAFEITEYPEEVFSGEAFTVRWNACEGAERYRVCYATSGDAIHGEVTVPGTQTSATLTIDQISHQIQAEYTIRLYVVALAAGYKPYSTGQVRFELLDSAKPTVTAAKTVLACGESVQLTVAGRRARDLRVKINGAEKGHIVFNAPGGTGDIALSFDAEGIYQVQVATRDQIDAYKYGIWSNWSDPVTLAVLSDIGAQTTLILPRGVKTIDEEALMGIDAVRVVIPNGCTTLRNRAFANCPNLAQVVIPASVTTIEGDPFAGCGDLAIIAPEGSTAWHRYINQ